MIKKCSTTTQTFFILLSVLQIHLNLILCYKTFVWFIRSSHRSSGCCWQQKALTHINESSICCRRSLQFDICCCSSCFPQMEVGSIQNTVIGMLDKQKELDAKVKAVKNSVVVSIVQLFKVVFVDSWILKSFLSTRLSEITNIRSWFVFQVYNQWLSANRKWLFVSSTIIQSGIWLV